MSEYVYFNEPGYEGQMGSPEGNKANIGYSNIVRVQNILHAMIDQIDNPPKEFENVIYQNFSLKKKIILEEIDEWIINAKAPADYGGLVKCHNGSIAALYETNPAKYAVDLLEARKKL
jgi:hypothetical protein